jgi:hypothetical protein
MEAEQFDYLQDLLSLRFYSQVIRACRGRPTRPAFLVTEDGCLVYDGSLNDKGYGRRGTGELVHRAAWTELVGRIPEGYEVHHCCSRKNCARIDHLMCLSKEAHALIEGRPLKLKADDVEAILGLIVAGVPHKQIAEQFDVVRPYISLIKFGKRWASVVRPFWQRMGVRVDEDEPIARAA